MDKSLRPPPAPTIALLTFSGAQSAGENNRSIGNSTRRRLTPVRAS